MPYSLDSAKGRAVQGGVIAVFLVLALVLASSQSAQADEVPRIEVFVTEEFLPLTHTRGTTVYVIDGLARMEAGLSRNLPGDPQAAREAVHARLGRMEAGLAQQLENAAQGLARAMHYGIDRYPAIVFDGQAVVYGILDVDAARQRWRQWQKTQDGR